MIKKEIGNNILIRAEKDFELVKVDETKIADKKITSLMIPKDDLDLYTEKEIIID